MASVLARALVVLFICSFRFAVIFGRCSRFLSSCSSGQVCCRNRCVHGSNCLYQSCSMNSHCSVNEACCSGMCQYGSDCLDKSCSKKFDCSVGQSCCSNVCEDGYDCSGHLCSSSNDCSVGQDCCDGICDYCVDQTPIIVGAIVASLGAFFPLIMFIYCCHRRARLGRPGRVVLGRPVTTTVATKTHSAIHAPPQVYQQGYQQGYPYQSLPQKYDQYQNANPPPNSGGMATGCVLPPPYNPETPTYGAIQST